MEENKKPDDGSLAFLNIPRDESNRSFNCDENLSSSDRQLSEPIPRKPLFLLFHALGK